MNQRLPLSLSLLVLLALGINCGGQESMDGPTGDGAISGLDGYPPTAQLGVHQQFIEDLSLVRHPSDGGGSARMVLADGEDGSVRCGEYGTWTFEYTAGPHGILRGGSLFLLVPPFWGWSTPQPDHAQRPGYTVVTTEDEGLLLISRTVDRNLMQVEIDGRDMLEGETIRIVYGAEGGAARADDYAEQNSMFYFKVDGDGDGVSQLVDDRPAIKILPGPPTRLVAHTASTSSPGGQLRLTIAVLDAMASTGCQVEGRVFLQSIPEGLQLPAEVQLTDADQGIVQVPFIAGGAGTYRIEANLVSESLEDSCTSNPLKVGEDLHPVFWGDLHGHSNYSDGTGTPRQFFEYARNVASLDVAVLTDHDHFGVRFMDATPEIWEEIKAEVERINEPGRFVALLGYEWTSWLYGHRHVVYFDGSGEVFTSVGGTTTTPDELWNALRGKDALTFAHHSAGGPVATDWSFVPDEHIEPVTEIMSVHGSSESSDSPSRIYGAVRGNTVRDQLDRGLIFGFIGSGDGHDGHPGLAHLSPNAGFRRTRPDPLNRRASQRMGNGGLAAIRALRLEEEAILEAFRSRNVYATSGPRIWMDVSLAGHPMGSRIAIEAIEAASVPLGCQISGTSGLEYVDIIQKGKPTQTVQLEGKLDVELELQVQSLAPGDYVYVRVLQNDGALAWSSPFYID